MEDEIRLDVVNEKPSWVLQIKDKFSNMESIPEKQRLKKRGYTISRLPATVRKNFNHYDYAPYKVSIGPWHHGQESCKQTEQIKESVVLHSLKIFDKTIDDYIRPLTECVQATKDAYEELDPEWEQDHDNAFLQLMIYDGCFLLEVLHEASTFYVANRWGDDYDWDSPVWGIDELSPKELMEYYRHDMLLLENQIPISVLEKLFVVQTNKSNLEAREHLHESILKFFSRKGTAKYDKCNHLLAIYRHNLVSEELKQENSLQFLCKCFMVLFMIILWLPYGTIIKIRKKLGHNSDGMEGINFCYSVLLLMGQISSTDFHLSIPSATDLDKVGIGLTSKTKSLKDITFAGRNLGLPQIYVDGATKSMFLNIITYERLQSYCEKGVTSYIYFMSSLIQSADDVRLLRSRGIIHSKLHADEIVELFNSLTTEGTMPDPDTFLISEYRHVAKSVTERFNKMSNEWRRDLWQNYLRSPWAIVSLVAAFLLFALTIVQTVYTVLSYYNS